MDEEKVYNAVIYTDGSALPNGKHGGGGHGYIYNINDVGVKHNDRPTNINLTTIGYVHNDQMLKYNADKVKPSYYIDTSLSYGEDGTNNRAELLAVIDILKILINKDLKFKSILIRTDSMYVINVFNMVSSNDDSWRDNSAPNVDLREKLYEIYMIVNDTFNIDLSLMHVDGHSGDTGNDIADRLAYLAREGRFIRKTVISDNANSYWKTKAEKHPLINYKHLFFTNDVRMDHNNGYTYVVMEYKTDIELGKKHNEPTFGVVRLSKPVEIVEELIELYMTYMGTLSLLSAVNTNTVYSNKYHRFSHFKVDCFMFNKKKHSLTLVNEDNLISAINPPGLAKQSLDKTLTLNRYIDSYLNKENKKVEQYVDITEYIYTKDAKGKPKIKITNKDKLLKIDVDIDGVIHKIPIMIGVDTLSYNQFSKLTKKKIKVMLLIIKLDERSVETYTIIDIDNGEEIGMYTNFYSNKYFLKVKKSK